MVSIWILLKTRQYTCAANSKARRSCQTVMYHLLKALTTWLAPILSFTAEEIWQTLPGHADDSVFLQDWYNQWPMIANQGLETTWPVLQLLREQVNKALELKRQEGAIGSGLDASVTLYVDDKLQALLSPLGKELRFVLITSKVNLQPLSARTEQAPV